jgi:hypothetical protein
VYVFFFSIIPYLLNIVNFMGYPKEVDGDVKQGVSLREMLGHLKDTLVMSFRRAGLRRLMLESMGFEGFFAAGKDYLQPILKAAALPLTAALFTGVSLSEEQQSVVLIGPVYFVLFLLSAWASRKAHVLVERTGHEDRTARFLWAASFAILSGMFVAMFLGVYWAIIAAYVVLYMLQNVWRPVLISRFDSHGDEEHGATILSIESQAKSAATMVAAPVMGFAVDVVTSRGIGATAFWPVAALGATLALLFLLTSRVSPQPLPAAGGVDQPPGEEVAPRAD